MMETITEVAPIKEQLLLLLKVLGAMGLGGVIGFEREVSDRPAGLRTHMLVAGASAFLIHLGEYVVEFYAREGLNDLVEADPFRTVGAVVTGIAFLGAGTIVQKEHKMTVHGLTTAASLLFCGTIGIASAVNLWVVAVALTVFTILVLRSLHRVERWIAAKSEN
ncbi:MgtC/SapB family protein [Pelagicoccus sp. SDUM812002]|uniref:MgtC/SapB family protein n=1 Tax=Pelagicoccus sp. SDUM812002 TaxID=3041266 RepID=UPI00281025EB|nr:MgtC/SapB family protein [Pelagicoccus sp. SDUM812002]MDQ8186216.1 MgtC/SapB family protein [Pelagicoccus sp. SDUM812002]